MRRIKKLSCFLIVLSAFSFCGGNAYAQNVFKLDFTKTSQKFSIWVQKQAENFENSMKEIAESQFGTFIGDGIKAAKEAFSFAKGKLDEAKKLYGNVKGKVDVVKEAPEYKAAMLSKQVASETVVLDTLKKQRDTEIAKLKSESKVKMVTLDEKIEIAKENHSIAMKLLEDEMKVLETDEEKEIKRQEIELFEADSQGAINALENERSEVDSTTKDEIKIVDENFAASIAAQAMVIADLGVEIKELLKQQKREDGEMDTDPDSVIENAIEDFSYKKGVVITLEEMAKKEKSRQRRKESISLDAGGLSVNIISKTADKIEEEEQTSSTSETNGGKSEALQTAILQTVAQIEAIYEHLLVELKGLELETANILANNAEYQVDDIKSAVNVCNYETDKDRFTDKLKGIQSSINDISNTVKSTANDIKEGVNEVRETVSEVVGVARDVVAVGTTVAATVETIKTTVEGGNADKDAITGLTGM